MAERPITDDEYATLVRSLLDDLAGTAITRLELRHDDLHVVLRRTPGAMITPLGPGPAPTLEEEAVRPAHWHAVVAPLTGVFYGQPSPDDEPYVQVGSHVESDHIVGLIETMKMFNEVTADVTGIVREIRIESGALVEAGQPLLYVEPGADVPDPSAGL